MRKLIKYLVIALFCTISSACSDYLNTIPIDKASPETFLENDLQARSLIAGIYNCFYDANANFITPYTYENMCDNSYNASTWEHSTEFAKGTQTATSVWAEYKWSKNWLAISRSNGVIRDVSKSPTISQSSKTKFIAESRLLRAYFYFDLLNFYGRIPILDENSPLDNPKREDISKVLLFIKADIAYSIENVEHKFGGGEVSKGAAYMLRLRVAQYEYDHETVISAAKSIKGLGYDLYSDFTTLFLDPGINDVANKEVIFKINYALDLESSHMTMLWYHWNSFQTTLPMVNSFFTAKGLPIEDLVADGGGSIPKDDTYDADRPFENRDPRFKLSILYPGGEYRLVAQSRYQKNWIPGNWGNLTGFRPKKGADEYLANTQNDGNDKIMMRYGEVLLAWAEAENELGRTANVYPLIDQLRTRVHMITLTASLPNLNKQTMRALIRNERRVELFHEGQRWFDIRRWKIAEDVMVDAMGFDVSKISHYPIGGGVTEDWKYEPMIVDRRSFNISRDYLWPIPQSEINSNDQMKNDQNPNY